MLEIKHHIVGVFPEPWAVTLIESFLQCRYEVVEIFDDNFNFYSASCRVVVCTYTAFLCTPFFFCLIISLLTLKSDYSMMQHHCRSLYWLIEWESKYLFSILPSILLMCNLCLWILHIILDLYCLVSVCVVLPFSILHWWENWISPHIWITRNWCIFTLPCSF